MSRLALALALLLAQQGLGQESILESKGRVVLRDGRISLADTREMATRQLGAPSNGGRSRLWTYPNGLSLHFDAKGHVDQIILRAPFAGRSAKGIRVGDTANRLRARYPEITNLKKGWNQAHRIAFFLDAPNGKVEAMRVDRQTVPRPPRPTLPTRPGTRPPAKPPGGVRPPALAPPNPGTKSIVVLQKNLRAVSRGTVVRIPVAKYPHDQGVLLVRVGFPPGVRAEQIFGGGKHARTKAKDYLYDADLVEDQVKGRGPLTWSFLFRGEGDVRLRVIWFRRKKDAKSWAKRRPYAQFVAVKPPPPPFEALLREVRVIWDSSWQASVPARWVRGPSGGWPTQKGRLLIRARGAKGVRRFLWRAGLGPVHEEPLGDITVAPDVLARGRPRNLLEAILGGDDGSLSFAFTGRGPARVRVLWLPDEQMLPRFSREHPLSDPVFFGGSWTPLDRWITPTSPEWWNVTDFEHRWNDAPFETPTGTINFASPRHGARIFRSGRDPQRSRGSAFDRGLWVSEHATTAWIESRFLQPTRVSAIELATAGAFGGPAEWILVDLLRQDGTWERIAALSDTNVNMHRLPGGGRAASRPWWEVRRDRPDVSLGVRILVAGPGPFRVGDVRVLGRPAGDPDYGSEVLPAPPPVAEGEIGPRDGPRPTGLVVRRDEVLILDVGGTWVYDASDTRRWYPCGFEGYPRSHVEAFFSRGDLGALLQGVPMGNLPFGALLARVGDGPWFRVLSGSPFRADRDGEVQLALNVTSAPRSSGRLQYRILGGALLRDVPAPAPGVPSILRVRGQALAESDGAPLAGLDVIVQEEAWPRRVFGGGRTDNQGRFDLEAAVPPGVAIVIRFPERRQESKPRIFTGGGEWVEDFRLF